MNVDFVKILESLREYSLRAYENLFDSCNSLAEDLVTAYEKRRDLEGENLEPADLSSGITRVVQPIQNKASDIQDEVKVLHDTTDMNIQKCEEFMKKGHDISKQVASIGESESFDRKNIAKRESENFKRFSQDY